MIYYPYLRGRQFDLKALTTFATESHQNVVPVIEPVRDIAALPKTLQAFINHQQPVAVIQNPQVDHYNYQAEQRYPINALFESPWVQRAVILTPLLPPDQLNDALVIVQHYADLKLFIDHDWLPASATVLAPPEARMRRLLTANHQVFGHLFDHNEVRDHSADFAKMPDSFFTDDQTFARQYHETGFGDYLTQGKPYFEHGHPSRTVTLHLIYLQDGMVRIHHFVSDQNEDFKHQKEKYFEALAKTIAWFDTQPAINQTPAIDQLRELAKVHKFPGMGILKQLTLEHHLVMMARYMDEVH